MFLSRKPGYRSCCHLKPSVFDCWGLSTVLYQVRRNSNFGSQLVKIGKSLMSARPHRDFQTPTILLPRVCQGYFRQGM